MVASTHQIAAIAQMQEETFLRLDSLRAVHIGGSITYSPLLTRIRLLVCNHVILGYGSTEAGTVAFCPADPIHGMDRAVGIRAPWVDLDVVSDDGTAQESGHSGALRIRALGQGHRYRKHPDGQVEMDRSEWFDPGDQAALYRNGLLMIMGRVNEIINRGGVKVAPDVIEEALRHHPNVADVAAVGVLDAIGIEQIWVGVVPRQGKDFDVQKFYDWCRENIRTYLPDRVFPLSEVPRNRLGKIARETLRDHLQSLERAAGLP